MKKKILSGILMSMLYSVEVFSGEAFATRKTVACVSEAIMNDVVVFTLTQDIKKFEDYINRAWCFPVKDGLRVYVTKTTSDIWGEKAEIEFMGQRYWTLRKSLKNKKGDEYIQ